MFGYVVIWSKRTKRFANETDTWPAWLENAFEDQIRLSEFLRVIRRLRDEN